MVDDEREEQGLYVRNEYRRGQWDGPLSYWEENACRDRGVAVDDPVPVRVLDRVTRHYRCGEVDQWVDASTGLVLRWSAGGEVREVVSLDLDPARGLGDDRFSTKVPDGGVDAADVERDAEAHPLGRVIEAGARLPAVEGVPVRGADAPELPPKGRWTLVLVTAPWCPKAGCGDGWEELRSGAHEHVVVVSLMDDLEASRSGFADWTSDVPVVHVADDDLRPWDLGAVPTWIVFDPDGRVADAEAGRLDNLDEVLAAVAAGRRPPDLDRAPTG
jgi:hypothetical protein